MVTLTEAGGGPGASPVMALAYACVEPDVCPLALVPPPSSGVGGGVILGKNRHGPGGEMPVYIDYRTLRVSEALPDEEDKWPAVNKK